MNLEDIIDAVETMFNTGTSSSSDTTLDGLSINELKDELEDGNRLGGGIRSLCRAL